MTDQRALRSKLWPTLALALAAVAPSSARAGGIPEPGLIFFGRVWNEGVLVTQGALSITLTPQGGGEPISASTTLAQLFDRQGESYSYSAYFRMESRIAGSLSTGVIELPTSGSVTYRGQLTVNGNLIQLPSGKDTTIVTPDSRGRVLRVDFNIGPYPPGDGNGDGEVTPGDTQLLLEALLDPAIMSSLIDQQLEAFDANCDGQLTPIDAQWIFEAFLGQRTLQRCTTPSRLIVGAGAEAVDPDLTLRVGTVEGQAGGTITVPIFIENADAVGPFSLLFVHTYALEYEGLQIEGTFLEDWYAAMAREQLPPGRTKIVAIPGSAAPIQGDGVMVNVVLRVNPSARGRIPMLLMDLIDGVAGATTVPGTAFLGNAAPDWTLYR